MDMVAPKRIIQTLDRREPDEKNAARTLPKVWQPLLCCNAKMAALWANFPLMPENDGLAIKNRNFHRSALLHDKLRAKMPHEITIAFLAM
ncbi:hypothetical protein [Phyllobacterium sp. YR531]|uniref:hypothetical protein n=1 Tax=Phyllobacterium sp. YR531 TaxID=1144343 RepID=UPI000593A014|nr:hypothetical protein [Phyllobacterium sp. YR531]